MAMHTDILHQRVERWAVKLKVKPVQIRIQPMSRKWASCSSAGRVSFSRELCDKSVAFQDCVIVHELLHLRIRNHGRLLRATLRMHLPGNPWVDRL